MKTKTLGYLIYTSLIAALFIFTLSVSGSNHKSDMPSKSIVEIAADDARFTILVDALTRTGLAEALQGEGPFTVFAPTNDAFKALFKDLGVEGLEDISNDQLKPVLLYHVVSGKVMAADVKSGDVPTLNSKNSIKVETTGQGVVINTSANVVITDIEGTNGVIHVIDAVLVP